MIQNKGQICEITGINYNNPDICIKGNGNYGCVCKECMQEINEKIKNFMENINKNDSK